jgi:hypothetical protein
VLLRESSTEPINKGLNPAVDELLEAKTQALLGLQTQGAWAETGARALWTA